MTRANRRAIRDAAQSRERGEQQPATRSAVPIDDAEVPLTDLIADLRKEKELVGLAAMVVVDGQIVASAVDGERIDGKMVRTVTVFADTPFDPPGDLTDAVGLTTVTRVDDTLAPTFDASDRRLVTVNVSWRIPGRDDRLSSETSTLISKQ